MVKSKSVAKKHYKEGIEDFGGADTYTDCAKNNRDDGFLAVAKCLQDAKTYALKSSRMVERYEDSA